MSVSFTVAPNTTLRARELRGIDDLGLREDGLDLARAALDEALALLGGVVLGVLLEVAVRARLLDVAHVLGALDLAQALELVLEELLPPRRHREASHGLWYSCSERTPILPARSCAMAPTAARAAEIVV